MTQALMDQMTRQLKKQRERSEAMDNLYYVARRTLRGSSFAAIVELLEACEQAHSFQDDAHGLEIDSIKRATDLLETQL